jgi:hypothetical protein
MLHIHTYYSTVYDADSRSTATATATSYIEEVI